MKTKNEQLEKKLYLVEKAVESEGSHGKIDKTFFVKVTILRRETE
jgi:hypothetical protein